MLKIRILSLFILLSLSIVAKAQYFKVEFDAFSPPIKAMLENVEGKPAKNFLMKDTQGKDHTLTKYKGKKILLWFWENNPQSELLNTIIKGFIDQNKNVVFLSLYNPQKSELPAHYTDENSFIILPNAAFLGEAVYDKELGTPRLYLIDENQIVKMLLPESYMSNNEDVITVIDSFLKNKIH